VKLLILLRGKALTEKPIKQKATLKEHIKSLTTANFDVSIMLMLCFGRAAFPLNGVPNQFVRIGTASHAGH
jgi:hypothetical protein